MRGLLLAGCLLIALVSSAFGQSEAKKSYVEGVEATKQGDCKLAVVKFERALQFAPPEATELRKFSNIFYSQCLSKLGRYDEALTAIEKAIVIDPDDIASYFDRVHVLEAKEDFYGVIKQSKEILKMDAATEQQANANFYIGKSYLFLENYNQARKFFDKSIALQPGDGEFYFYRGMVNEYEGDLKAAEKDYGRTIAVANNYAPAYAYRGFVRIKLVMAENEGTFINVLGRDACSDLEKAVELGFTDAREALNTYCK